ncbi:MAG: hypothetical protein JO317_03520 [Verrucomicrobiae bacterium]|nr:hypothetical protein [Verrucomicrobiae bacterium]
MCPCCLQEMDVEPGRKPPKNQNTYRYAPNLLKALKQMVEQYGGMVDGGVEPSAARAVSYARAVIAKAERRS